MREQDHLQDIHPKLSLEPAFFLLIIILAVFLGEILIMVLLPRLIPVYVIKGSVVDAILLVVVLTPILYLFSFRPLQSHIKMLKKMQGKLRRSEDRYRSLVESTDDSIYLVDKEYRYLFMNSKHMIRMGISNYEDDDFLYSDLHSSEDTKEFTQMIDKVFETGNSIKQEHKSQRDNMYFLRTFSPVKDQYGTVEAVTVISKDISKIKSDLT